MLLSCGFMYLKTGANCRLEAQKGADFRRCTPLTKGQLMASKNSKSSAPKIEVDRKATNGQFTTAAFAKAHPKITEHEIYKRKSA